MGKVTRRYVFIVEVEMYEAATHPDEFTEFYNVCEEDLTEIQKWVTERELGTRTSYNTWKLIDNAAVTMFLLKWNE